MERASVPAAHCFRTCQADLIACVSPTTQRALLALQLAQENKVTTVLNGLNENFSPVRSEEADSLVHRFGLGARDSYLIHVGSDLPRKNRQAVLETFIALKNRAAARGTPPLVQSLVFVGPELEQNLMELASRHGVADQVRTLQEVSHEELRALYARATALVFPSLQEGFGWPLIEAQACGCPVFTSNLPPMNEIGGARLVTLILTTPRPLPRRSRMQLGSSTRCGPLACRTRGSTRLRR